MRKRAALLQNSEGYTLIEMMVALAVISILLSLVVVSYDTLRARIRYSQMKADMDSIAQAAYNDYVTHTDATHDNTWADYVGPGAAPSFVNPTELLRWPAPPCPGWEYNWDNLTASWQNLARVTVTMPTGGPFPPAVDRPIFAYCLQSAETSCFTPDINGYVPLNLSALPTPYIYCNE